jgi:O-antigen/teichoic acid export membrane protein
MNKLKNLFASDPQIRDQAMMSVGALASMVLNFVSLIILARIYGPKVTGVSAAFLSLNNLCLIPATLRLETALLSPKDEEEAFDLAFLSWFCAIAFAVLLGLGILVFRGFFVDQYGPSVAPFLALSPVLLIATTGNLILTQLMVREGIFFWLAIILFSQTIISISLKFGFLPIRNLTNPLIWAEVISQSIILVAYLTTLRFVKRIGSRPLSFDRFWSLMIHYKEFPRDVLPASWIETFNSNLPILFLTRNFGEAEVGHFNRAMQFLSLPNQVFGTPISSTFRNKGAKNYRETGDCRAEFRKTFIRLLIIGLVIFPIASAIFPVAIVWLLGPEWKQSGNVGQVAAIYAFFGFVASPLSTMLFIAKKTIVNLWWILLTLSCNATALWFGIKSGSFINAILYWSVSYAAMYVLVIALSYRYSVDKGGVVSDA